MAEQVHREAFTKKALLNPLTMIEDGSVWTAEHPKFGRVIATNFEGDWKSCPWKCAEITGRDPQYTLKREFLKNHTYDTIGVAYWELPKGKPLINLINKKDEIRWYILVSDVDKSLFPVSMDIAKSYADRLDAINPENLTQEETNVFYEAYMETYVASGIPAPAFEDYVKAILIKRYQNVKN